LVTVRGEFAWHDHPDIDEVVIVMEASLNIEFRDGIVILELGEMFAILKGLEHKPTMDTKCKIMIAAPRGVINSGE
jgi:mannose-6-phosphate isomerase-like protein (cupin superfamily)